MMPRLLNSCAFAALLFATPALSQDLVTEIFLEEGHTEVQLLSGDFIGLSAGAEIVVSHDENGMPLEVEVLRGSVQMVSRFGGSGGLRVRAGGRTMVIGDGAAVITMDSFGGMSVTVLNGAGPLIDGLDAGRVPAGNRFTIGSDGVAAIAPVTAAEMARAADSFLGDGVAAPGLTPSIDGARPPEVEAPTPRPGVISGRRDRARDATGLNAGGATGGSGGDPVSPVTTNPPDVDVPTPPEPPTPPDPDPPTPPDPDPPTPDIVLPPNVKEVFDKLPPGQLDDLDNLPKRFKELVDSLTREERRLLEEFIASLP